MKYTEFCPLCFRLYGDKVAFDHVIGSLHGEKCCPILLNTPFDESKSHFSFYYQHGYGFNCRYRIGNLMIKTSANNAHVYRYSDKIEYIGSIDIPFDDLIIQMLSEPAIIGFVTNYNILK